MAPASIDHTSIVLGAALVLGVVMSVFVMSASSAIPKWMLFESAEEPFSLRSAWSAVKLSNSLVVTPACALVSVTAVTVFGASVKGAATVCLVGAMLTLAEIDRKHSLLPDVLTLPLLWAGLLLNVDGVFVPLRDAVIGAASGFVSLWLFYWGGRAALRADPVGYGDLKFFSAIGAWLGVKALPVVLLVAGAVCIAQIVRMRIVQRQGAGGPCRAPFGPGMALGATIFLFLHGIVAPA